MYGATTKYKDDRKKKNVTGKVALMGGFQLYLAFFQVITSRAKAIAVLIIDRGYEIKFKMKL